MPSRRYGMVAQIRVNPEDCQSVLDMMKILGINPYDGRSFAQCVSVAFSSMLGSYRQGGVLPEVDSFQFLNRLGPFIDSQNNRKKAAMSEQLYQSGGRMIGKVELPRQGFIGEYIPEHLRATVEVPESIKARSVEELVEKYHQLKGLTTPNEVLLRRQVEAELDRRNTQDNNQ